MSGSDFPVVEHLFVAEAGVIGGQACADQTTCTVTHCPTIPDKGGPRVMEFFGKHFFVKNVSCFARDPATGVLDASMAGKLREASARTDGLVALAGAGCFLDAGFVDGYTRPEPMTHSRMWWWDHVALAKEFYFPLSRFQPSPWVAQMIQRVEDAMGGVPYIALHWRRGDRGHPEMGAFGQQYWNLSRPSNTACLLNTMLNGSGLQHVFVATNSGTPSERAELRAGVHGRVWFLADFEEAAGWREELSLLVAELFLCSRGCVYLSLSPHD
eukprot:1255907-Rhodomonas_salina.1